MSLVGQAQPLRSHGSNSKLGKAGLEPHTRLSLKPSYDSYHSLPGHLSRDLSQFGTPFFLLGVRSRCLWLSGETELKSYNCTFSRARSAIQPTHILAQEESEQGLPLAGTNLTTPLTTVQFSGACSSLSAHSPGTPVSGENWSHQSGIYW